MYIWYPPWAKRGRVDAPPPSWTVKERHRWMSDALHLRRKIQASNFDVGETENYSRMLSQFYEDPGEEMGVIEILSDGLGDVEPNWHGLRLGSGEIQVLPPWLQKELAAKVADHRRRVIEKFVFKTHLDIGRKLFEPTLFLVSRASVKYYHNDHWRDLDDPKAFLPLTLVKDGDEHIEWDKSEHIKQNLLRMREDDSYQKALIEIKKSLSVLSTSVLWPALLDSTNKDGESLSLILINASAWQVPGVWALHAHSLKGRMHNVSASETHVVRWIIDPPLLCIQDVLGATFRRDSTHFPREKDVRLFRKCKGVTSVEFDELDEEDRQVYDRPWSADPFERYGTIYRLVCEKYMRDAGAASPEQTSEEEPFFWLEHALKKAFVAWACQAESPEVSRLILQEVVRLCLGILRKTEPLAAKLREIMAPSFIPAETIAASAVKWLEALQAMAPLHEDYFQPGKKIVQLLVLGFLAAAFEENALHESQARNRLLWCSQGLRTLLMSASDAEALPNRQSYNAWLEAGMELSASAGVLFQKLKQAGVDEEASWFIVNVLQQAEQA